MGYTHYFENKGHKDDQKNFLKVLAEAKKLYESLPEHSESAGGYSSDDPLKICGCDGEGEPEFEVDCICFNGDASVNLDHEGFLVIPEPFNDFCKTARKPYDLLVCAVLISMKKHFVNFSYSSDGKPDDWKPAKEFYEKVCGKK